MARPRALLNHLLFWGLFLGVAAVFDTVARNHGQLSGRLYLRQFADLYTWVRQGRVVLSFYLSLWVFTRVFFSRVLVVVGLEVVLLGLFDSLLGYALEQKIIGPLTGQWFSPPGVPALLFTLQDLTTSWLYVMLAFVFKHVQDHVKSEALRHEKNAIELAYLKSQLNPHFLFNSMNNLYGLALTEPARTPDAILKLAEMMRYMLYESNETHVALAREVAYLHSYVALEKLRHDGETHVEFRVEGDVAGRQLAPLLLIAFVENAFKHGCVDNAARPIRLRLVVEPDRLIFTAENQVVSKNKDQVGGVGLASVRRRLALLYPGRHALRIRQEADQFYCELTLQTAEAEDAAALTTLATAPATPAIPELRPAPVVAPAAPTPLAFPQPL